MTIGVTDNLLDDLWWFIENVGDETLDRNDRFFKLRERVRGHASHPQHEDVVKPLDEASENPYDEELEHMISRNELRIKFSSVNHSTCWMNINSESIAAVERFLKTHKENMGL